MRGVLTYRGDEDVREAAADSDVNERYAVANKSNMAERPSRPTRTRKQTHHPGMLPWSSARFEKDTAKEYLQL